MKSIHSTYKGLISGLFLIALSVVLFYGFHLSEKGNSQYMILFLFGLSICWPLLALKKNTQADHTFNNYFSEGFKSFIVVTLLMVIYTFFFYHYNPQILEKVILENNQLILEQGNRTAAEIEENSKKLRSIFMPMMLSFTTIKFLALGAVVSAAGAFVLTKELPNFNKR
jgi:hypothetical protein